MKQSQRRLLNVTGRATFLALGLLLPWTFGVTVHRQPDQGLASNAEEATPDCEALPVDPFPSRERARHLATLGVERWHGRGYRGQGVKIAVLDSGFRGYRDQLGKALPDRITTRSFRADGNLEAKDSQHGILCSEVLHALAPEAELLFANWDPNCPEQFLAAVRWARQAGARIVSCSVIMPSWSDGEGGGVVNEALAGILGAGGQRGDLLCFASAGNTALRHWSGPFHDGGAGVHQWKSGRLANALTPWDSDRVSVELYWRPGCDYELSVTDYAGQTIGTTAAHRGTDRSCRVVQFLPRPRTSYQVRVRLLEGPGQPFHLAVLGGNLSYTTARGSIACPADGAAVQAVGAVFRDGQRAGYSSCGPNSPRPKPDFVAPVPFPSLWRDRPFTGTSAAAPQAAALAALCWSRHPDWTAEQVRDTLRAAARDLATPGHDCETGFGMIALPAVETP